jgi:hypothetical protein
MARKILTIAVAGTAFLAGGAALAVEPAAAGATMYHWRTESGTYAYTDDEKAIPERYRAQVESRKIGSLEDYERYTPAVSSGPPSQGEAALRAAAGESAAESRRLEYLRALNAPRDERRNQDLGVQTLTIPTGGGNSPAIEVQTRAGDEPVVIETIRTWPKGSIVTRSDLVVRQGDRIITIVKPQLNETDTMSDIIPEAELLDR